MAGRSCWSVPAWGVSLDVAQEWGVAPEGYVQRRDTVITGLPATGPGWAEDLWNAEPVADRLGFRDRPAEAGPWAVVPDADRPRWQCKPLEGVGPLRFGMSHSGPGDSQVWARAERAGDTSVSAACFCVEGWEYHG
ncbi:hypothetical protein ACIHEI_16255 [Kitasatospora sp. NPDC051984]|uniref:hypothetical protein n=1 Tax=Kitasatospora sp. NPDC051984 TaxID=3364059 RepID=UPI0037CA5739